MDGGNPGPLCTQDKDQGKEPHGPDMAVLHYLKGIPRTSVAEKTIGCIGKPVKVKCAGHDSKEDNVNQ
jgi:hypothetical protein